MADLKLPRLPDRTPMKLALSVPPDLARALTDYQTIYNARYSASEPLSELAVHMLAAFLASDRQFAKERAHLKESRT